MTENGLLSMLGMETPIIQAPMGGVTTVELVAAVSNAGGLGSLAGAYMKPEQILEDARRIRELTGKPFAINLFAGGYETAPGPDAQSMLSLLGEIHRELDLPAPVLPVLPPDPFPAQLEAVLEAQPPVFSFTFGVPTTGDMRRLKARGIFTLGTATTVDEAHVLENSGVTAVVAQGAEAGGHRGTFLGSFETSMTPALDLVRAIRNSISLPVIASGGLMNGDDIARALARGASAAQLGTAFLACPEAATPRAHRQAILAAGADTTVITRAFSGRPARGLRNAFIEKLQGREAEILPYPLQNALTRPMRTAAARLGNAGYLSLWAGQGVARARELPASTLFRQLVAEMEGAAAGR